MLRSAGSSHRHVYGGDDYSSLRPSRSISSQHTLLRPESVSYRTVQLLSTRNHFGYCYHYYRVSISSTAIFCRLPRDPAFLFHRGTTNHDIPQPNTYDQAYPPPSAFPRLVSSATGAQAAVCQNMQSEKVPPKGHRVQQVRLQRHKIRSFEF